MATKTDAKAVLRRLIDELCDANLYALKRFAEHLRAEADPLQRTLRNAPPDDGPEAEEERQAVAEANKDLAADRVLSHEEACRCRLAPA